MKTGTKCKIATLLVLALVVSTMPQNAFAASTKAKVSSQEELDKALALPNIEKIIIESPKNELPGKLFIDRTLNPQVSVVVEAANVNITVNADIKNMSIRKAESVTVNGTVQKISVSGSDCKINLVDDGSLGTLKLTGGKADLSVSGQSEVDKVSVAGSGTACNINLDTYSAPGSVSISGQQSSLNISGEIADKISVNVGSNAEGASITASVPVKLTTNTQCGLELHIGAECSSVKLNSEEANVSLINKTSGKITLTDSDGEKVIVKKGENVDGRDALQNAATEAEAAKKAEEKAQEEARKAEEKAREEAAQKVSPTVVPDTRKITDETVNVDSIIYRLVTTFKLNSSVIKEKEEYYSIDSGNLAMTIEYDRTGTPVHRYDYIYQSAGIATADTYYDADGKLHSDMTTTGEFDWPIYVNTIGILNVEADIFDPAVDFTALRTSITNISTEMLEHGVLEPVSNMGDIPCSDATMAAVVYSQTDFTDGVMTQEVYKYYDMNADYSDDANILRTVKYIYASENVLEKIITTATDSDGNSVEKTETDFDSAGNPQLITVKTYMPDGRIKKEISTNPDGSDNVIKSETRYSYGESRFCVAKDIFIYEISDGEESMVAEESFSYSPIDGQLRRIDKYTYSETNKLHTYTVTYSYTDFGIKTNDYITEYYYEDSTYHKLSLTYTIISYDVNGVQTGKIVAGYAYIESEDGYRLYVQSEYDAVSGEFNEDPDRSYISTNGDFGAASYFYPSYFEGSQP